MIDSSFKLSASETNAAKLYKQVRTQVPTVITGSSNSSSICDNCVGPLSDDYRVFLSGL
jgi:hypothetical protein